MSSSDRSAVNGSGSRRQRLRRRLGELPVFPTLLTAGNLACGIVAIFCAASTDLLLVHGAVLIFVAMFCDMLDGKVARMTHTEGEFGAELDSLADVVSFGVAPAMLVHRIVLGDNPSRVWGDGEGWMTFVVIFYAVLTAIRLARYNVEHSKAEATTTFKGLPSPGAAAFLCSWVLFYGMSLDGRWPASYFILEPATDESAAVLSQTWHQLFAWFLMGATVVMGVLMVSGFRFPHFANTLLGSKLSYRRWILLLLLLGLCIMQPLYGLILGTTAYVLIGAVPGAFDSLRRLRQGKSLLDEDDDDDDVEEPAEDAARPDAPA